MWCGMQPCGPLYEYNINANLVKIIEHLYDKATSLHKGRIGSWFHTAAGILSRRSTLTHPLHHASGETYGRYAEERVGMVTTGGRTTTSLHCGVKGLKGKEK